ncbi:MAG: hypothetical protein L6Q75_01310 [Burkholderiaceae bacterium]|nr:hypothetical protein [Burkholderiaceae bacterium]
MTELFTWAAMLGIVAGAFLMARSRPRGPRVLPPPRSRSTVRTFQETNPIARLFLETRSLQESAANWPRVLKGLNADDVPHIRTLLLELRAFDTSSPRAALAAIEAVCIECKRVSPQVTREALLERALLRMKDLAAAG